jgi:hypothetical protein
MSENHPMFSHRFQKSVRSGRGRASSVSYLPSPIKLHDYAAGAMAPFGSVVRYLGGLRGLPSQQLNIPFQRGNHPPNGATILGGTGTGQATTTKA